jgi:hypothetical protein
MTAKLFLVTLQHKNRGTSLEDLVGDVIKCLPCDFDVSDYQMTVVHDFALGFMELPFYSLNTADIKKERASCVMQITNFITLNGKRLE